MLARPLLGTRILDVTRLLPGPYATRLLAELGAEVVKIEAPEGGDYARWWPPLVGEPPASSAFRELNRGKRSVALDLRKEAGRDAFLALAAAADVLVDGFRPGVLSRLGGDPQALMQANPRLVYCAITGFGLTGPDADRPGHDLGYLARAGILAVTGPSAEPIGPGAQVADVGSSLSAVAGILAALLERGRTGRGSVVDVSILEAALAFNALNFGVARGGAPVVRGTGLLDGSRPCYGIYRAGDGRFLAVAALEPKFWTAFVGAIGLPHLASSGWDGGDAGRSVRAEVQARLMERSAAEWLELFSDVEACVELVTEVAEVSRDPQLLARGVVGGMMRGPLRVGDWDSLGAAGDGLAEAPALGADGIAVMREWGVAAEVIAALGAGGVFD